VLTFRSFMFPAVLAAVGAASPAQAAKPGGGGAANQAPTVAITAPASGTRVAPGTVVVIEAGASDADGRISKVEFFRDGALLARDTSAPFQASWSAGAAGSYAFTAIATDNARASSTSAAIALQVEAPPAGAQKRVVGYFTQWGIYTHDYRVRTLDARGTAAQLTHLIYAFGNVRNDRCELGVLQPTDPATGAGGDAYADYSRTHGAAESVDGQADVWNQPLRGHWNQLRKLKAKYPQLKVLISLGGWNWSRGFASAARPEHRAAFVASCVDAYIRGNLPVFDYAGGAGAAAGVFDGIDIDWEYPAACGLTCGDAEERENFTALLAEFRRQLDGVRPGLLLSVAVGAGIDKIRVTDPGLYQAHVDQINVMAYDFHGSWDTRTNHHSALFASPADPSSGDAAAYNADDAVQALLARGVPAAKLNLGIASYGRGWRGVAATGQGLYQTGSVAPGSLGEGVESFRELQARNAPSYFDPQAVARWSYDGDAFWSFDTPASIADKMSYVQVQGLGGAFLWDFAGDDDAGALLGAIATGAR
jgi:chitinase